MSEAAGPAPSPAPARAPAPAAPGTAAPEVGQGAAPVLVEDGASLGEGQVHKSVFLARLRVELEAMVDQVLAGTPYTGRDCPWIQHYLGHFGGQPVERVRAFLTRYAGGLAADASEAVLRGAVVARARAGVESWRQSGAVPSLPPDVPAPPMPSAADMAGQALRSLFRKAEGSAPGSGGDPAATVARLGPGQPLPPGRATDLARLVGAPPHTVRLHTGAAAAAETRREGAHAFAVGSHVALGGAHCAGTPVGDALLAHELAHVAQQARGGGAGGWGGEEQADRAALHALQGRAATVEAGGHGGLALRHCGGTDPAISWRNSSQAAQNDGKAVGQLGAVDSPYFNKHELTASGLLGVFESQAQAMAAAKATGQACCIIPENGRFAVYGITGFFVLNPTYVQNAGLKVYAGVVAILSAEGAVFGPGDYGSGGRADRAEPAPPGDPFAAYVKAADSLGGITSLSEAETLAVVQAAMRDTALTILARSEDEARARAAQYGKGEAGTNDSEHELILATARELRTVQEQLDDIDAEIALRESMPARRRGVGVIKPYPRDTSKLKERKKAKLVERARVRGRYPILGRYASVSALDSFIGRSRADRIAALAGDAQQVLTDIASTRFNIQSGDLNLWTVPSVLDATVAGLGLSATQRGWAKEKASAQKTQETVLSLALAVFSIGFGIAAAVFSGGTSLAFAAGAFGLGTFDAMRETEEYFVRNAATNTAIDNKDSLLPEEARKHWGWLVVAWAGVALDFADVLKAVNVGGEVAKVAKGVQDIPAAARVLAQGDQALLQRLMKAAGQFDIGDTLTADKLSALEARVGARIELEAAPATGRAGQEIRVVYVVDEAGRTRVSHIVAQAGANVGDLLLHTGTVRLLDRYSGVSGRILELWDSIRSFAGMGKANTCPFPAGSPAFESWHELEKLPGLISRRRAELDQALRGPDPSAAQELLRREIAWLENEVDIHRRIVEQLATEAGPRGFVAMGEGTRSAMEAGYKLPGFEHIGPASSAADLEKALTACLYYYRREGGGFTLVRKANADVKALMPEVLDGRPTGRFLEAGAQTRAERAAALVGSWEKGLQDAYDNLGKLNPGKAVVPLAGVRPLQTTIAQLDPTFQAKAVEILEPAFRRLYPDDTARALKEAETAAANIATHDLTAVQGTEHLRAAFGYRSAYIRGLPAKGTKEVGDVHHLVPLYLGGDHRRLVDLSPDLHEKMHSLIEGVPYGTDTTLAPGSILNALSFDKGAAVVDGAAVQLYQAVKKGDSWEWVPIGGG